MNGSQAALSTLRARRLRDLLKATWRRLRGDKVSPARLGAAVAVGVFIGCQPLFGLHLVLCLLVCVPLRLDAAVAYLAANISNPFVAPALVTLELEVGALLLTGEHVSETFERGGGSLVSSLVAQAAAGSIVVGLALSVASGALAALVMLVLGRRKGARASALARVTGRYRGAHPRERIYVAMKLGTDPMVREFASFANSLGDVLDVGCGRGQFTVLLQELGLIRTARGVDWDEQKISVARLAADDALEFVVGDATQQEFASYDTVLLIDLLHYLPADEQRALLRRLYDAVRPGGRLLVRELDGGSAGSAVGRSSERLAARMGYNRAEHLEFSSRGELVAELGRLGFSCEIRARRRAPLFLPNVLLIATKR